MTAALRFKDLTLGYDRHPAVHHLTGEVAQGALLAVCGPNGGGKSTLLKGIVGALQPIGGSVERVSCGEREIAYLPQAADIDRSFPVNVFDLVAMGHWRSVGWFGGLSRAQRARVFEAIAAVGLEGFEDRPIGTLSGGQMQRVLFARLLLQDSPVILLDEPFNAIDQRTVTELLALVDRWRREGRTVVVVLHDFDLVRRVFPETLLLARETVAWGRTQDVLAPENLLSARRMVEAFDREAHECERAA
ncbi:MAG: Zinc/manganese transport system ATP-binding protein [Hyphomicrobiales bacterium]|nr:Zinc/manganese transport system ATP-binding protein [Hyphomicrobiales bacterium]